MAKAMSSLERYPKRSTRTPENSALRRLLYGKKPQVYRVIFQIEEETSTVHILTVRAPRLDRIKSR
jgi:mRNA-degrading endonuclease RelE of RelBE toxin-antitoxin system